MSGNMARRRKYQYITDPVTKAAVVVESFVNKAKTEVDTWARDYTKKVREYTGDENRQVLAALKLAGFYEGLQSPDVRNAIREAINSAKSKQIEVVAAAVESGKVPVAVPREVAAPARTTAEKVRSILAGVVTGAGGGAGPTA